MAFFWVQQWWALPVIVEEPGMGDTQRGGGRVPVGRMVDNAGTQGPVDNNEISGASGIGDFSVLPETLLAG